MLPAVKEEPDYEPPHEALLYVNDTVINERIEKEGDVSFRLAEVPGRHESGFLYFQGDSFTSDKELEELEEGIKHVIDWNGEYERFFIYLGDKKINNRCIAKIAKLQLYAKSKKATLDLVGPVDKGKFLKIAGVKTHDSIDSLLDKKLKKKFFKTQLITFS